MKNIVIIGGGGHSRVLMRIVQDLNIYNIVGYVDVEDKSTIFGLNYLGNDAVLSKLFEDGVTEAVIGIGNLKSEEIRSVAIQKAKKIGFNFPVLISKTAIVDKEVQIGEGSVIMNGAIINNSTQIGQYSIINTGACIDHDCTIGEQVHIAPGSILCGGVSIANGTHIGAGSVLIENITISEKIILGANSLVRKDINSGGVFYGQI